MITKYEKHGKCHTRLCHVYYDMRKRCYNTKYKDYKYYGGRGITICAEWLNSFQAFYDWSISHGYNDNLTIDRIDNNKGYSPDNCRWATRKQQNRNQRRNVYLTYDGKTMIMKDWAIELNLNYSTIKTRHLNGWTDKECLFGKGVKCEKHKV